MALKRSVVNLYCGLRWRLRQCIKRLLLKRSNIPITRRDRGRRTRRWSCDGTVQALLQATFNAPGRPVVPQPLRGAEFCGRQARDQRDRFRGVAPQQRHLFHAGKSHLLGARRAGT